MNYQWCFNGLVYALLGNLGGLIFFFGRGSVSLSFNTSFPNSARKYYWLALSPNDVRVRVPRSLTGHEQIHTWSRPRPRGGTRMVHSTSFWQMAGVSIMSSERLDKSLAEKGIERWRKKFELTSVDFSSLQPDKWLNDQVATKVNASVHLV